MATSGSKSVAVTEWDTLEFSWWEVSQSTANNTTTIGWSLVLTAGSSGRISSTASKSWSVTIDGTTTSGTNTVGISNNATKTLASGQKTITHTSSGTRSFSYSFKQEFAITFSGTYIGTKTGSGSGTLDTINRKSKLTVAAGTLGVAQTLKVTRYDDSFTHSISYTCGTVGGTIATKSTATSISWTAPTSLAIQNATGKTVSIIFTITTYSGSANVGTNKVTVTYTIPSSMAPTCSLTVEDAEGLGYIQGRSKLAVTVSGTPIFGSPIASYQTTISGVKYTAQKFTTGYIFTAGTITVTAKVTDKRGYSGTETKTITVKAYSPPHISLLKVKRCVSLEDGTEDIHGEFAQITFSASATDIGAHEGGANFTLEYKPAGAAEYESISLDDYNGSYSVTEGVYRFEADSASTYNVRLIVSDGLSETVKVISLSTGDALMHWGASGRAMGIGKIAEVENGLDIGFVTRFYGGILHPILEPETDLNEVRTPNTYVGVNVSTNKYLNCPIDSGTFTLEVLGMGDAGQVKQRLSECKKTDARTYERIYYQGSWGSWFNVSDYAGTLLWQGGYYMTAGHTVPLSESVSKQRSGIVLVFSEFVEGAAKDQSFHCFFVDKKTVSLNAGVGHCFQMTTSNLAYFATKYLYINNTQITGHENNNATITGTCGITSTNGRFVLRYVIGV